MANFETNAMTLPGGANAVSKEELYQQIKRVCFDRVINMPPDVSDDVVHEIVSGIVFEHTRRVYLNVVERSSLETSIFNSLRRLGPLQPILEDASVTEIMVNGPNHVFIERYGRMELTNVKFESESELLNIINRIVKDVGREVNQSTPIVDARLKDGSRVNIVLPPVSLVGPVITIRKFPSKAMSMEQLLDWGAINEDAANFINKLVRAKYNIFIAGGTGSGKTTFLNALSNFIPSDERIITIEDSAELQISGPLNLISLETRNATAAGGTEISMRDLIKSSLRMRPDRIVVGEVRGSEAFDMLQAMNTGHDGSLSTGHANSTADMLSRLETMILSGADFPLDAIRQQIASSLDIIVYLGRLRDKSRRMLEMCEVLDYRAGNIVLNKLYEFREDSQDAKGRVRGDHARVGELQNLKKMRAAGLAP
ncbi:MAG: CpaF family protein [Clostridiales bacterium]|jgi:pilus assembly protein CpaF|nr:CpaF family protein [Clostridiales bacterium]